MRSESVREAGATFLLGMLLASAVIIAGQVGLPSGMHSPAPPGIWDSHRTLTVPFSRLEPVADTRAEDASAAREILGAGPLAMADRRPAPASPRLTDRTGTRPTAGDRRPSKGHDASRRDKPTGPDRPDRVTSGTRTDGRGAGNAGGKGSNGHATKGAAKRRAHGSPDHAVRQRAHRTVAAADHRDRPTIDHKRDAAGRKDKVRAAKGRSKRSHGWRGRSA